MYLLRESSKEGFERIEKAIQALIAILLAQHGQPALPAPSTRPAMAETSLHGVNDSSREGGDVSAQVASTLPLISVEPAQHGRPHYGRPHGHVIYFWCMGLPRTPLTPLPQPTSYDQLAATGPSAAAAVVFSPSPSPLSLYLTSLPSLFRPLSQTLFLSLSLLPSLTRPIHLVMIFFLLH
jgi:hypothetical protein